MKIINRLLGRYKPHSALPATAEGERIYAIGDIHGHLNLLHELMQAIALHEKGISAQDAPHIIILGDMIDRGPDSAQVINYLRNIDSTEARLTVLMGNHEDVLLDILDGQTDMLIPWMEVGGDATLRSFGIEPPALNSSPDAAAQLIREAIPRDIIKWLHTLPTSVRSGDYFFCHAGVRPNIPLDEQKRGDLMWIRQPFLSSKKNHGAIIVHGHSIEDNVHFRPNRIGIDTGAYRTGVLTALYLNGTEREIVSTGGAGT